MKEIITRSEAKAQKRTCYFTGERCKHGHVSERRVSDRICVSCSRQRNAWYLRKRRAEDHGWRVEKNAYTAQYLRKRRAEDHEWRTARDADGRSRKKQRRENDPMYREQDNQKSRQWAKDNPGKANARNATRRAQKQEQTPPWTKQQPYKKELQALYDEAARLTLLTGTRHEVDHIYPLKGKAFKDEEGDEWGPTFGLHVPWNLRVITRDRNGKKGNRLPLAALNKMMHGNPVEFNAAMARHRAKHRPLLEALELVRVGVGGTAAPQVRAVSNRVVPYSASPPAE